jgi:hypothetical protein
VSWLAVLSTWVAVESGNILTAYPGLGEAVHAGGGTVLLLMLLPYAVVVTIMILLDRRWHWNVNKHGGVWRDDEPQPLPLILVSTLAVIFSVVVSLQTAWVGHTGAEASWGDIDLDSPPTGEQLVPNSPDPIQHEGKFGGTIRLW